MKERPILFSAPMVRALLAGTKTQTRRVCKRPPTWEHTKPLVGSNAGTWYIATSKFSRVGYAGYAERVPQELMDELLALSPYGQPGDRLCVRETFYAFGRWITAYDAKKDRDAWTFIDMTAECGNWHFYDATEKPEHVASFRRDSGVTPMWWKRPAIFMPQAASRTTLEVTEVRVKKLDTISEADALAEGVEADAVKTYADKGSTLPAMRAYRDVWGAINGHDGPASWAANPWVWAVSFNRADSRPEPTATNK